MKLGRPKGAEKSNMDKYRIEIEALLKMVLPKNLLLKNMG